MLARAENVGQLGIRRHAHFVHGLRAIHVRTLPWPVRIALQMLYQRPAMVNIQQLQAPADAQHRQVAVQRLAEKANLHAVARRVGLLRFWRPLLPVLPGIDIAPARQQQPIQPDQRPRRLR